MWDGGWDDAPAGASPPADDPADGPAADDDWAAGDGPAPARWYAPPTPRGKIILVGVVVAVLVATLVGCLAGVDGLRQLKSMDLFDLI